MKKCPFTCGQCLSVDDNYDDRTNNKEDDDYTHAYKDNDSANGNKDNYYTHFYEDDDNTVPSSYTDISSQFQLYIDGRKVSFQYFNLLERYFRNACKLQG